ncbi:MAG TPA: DCC1-like thiol-disulfide oxidoreductase family protein [Gemmataceae bacterium]|nr:DCC1-like thiol-disulfide oxidoreductase family protein [Gemmataceae bacterium]
MKNGWTGGQYSLYRAVFAMYLLAHFLPFLPWGRKVFLKAPLSLPSSATSLEHVFPNVPVLSDSPAVAAVLLAAGAVLSVFFGIGLFDRAAALGLWYIWACLFDRDPLIANPSIPFVGWLLLAHVFLPPAPYGSWAARGRVDPGGGWRMPPAIFAAAWIVLAISYTYSGYTKLASFSWRDGTALARVLDNPLARPGWLREALLNLPSWLLHLGTWTALAFELAFAPLALLPRLRPWLWGMMLLMHLSLILVIDFADLSLGMVMMHLFTWDPGWVRPLSGGTERIFYDGHCGLCQRSVRLILAEDATAAAFRFAPLQGETFAALLTEKERAALPLSLVVRTEKGTLLTRSAGVLHILRRLGGAWRLLAGVLVLLPAALRDRLYDGVAAIRLHLFAQPTELCPLMPPSLRARFDP